MVADRGTVGAVHREWNVSEDELPALVASGVLEEPTRLGEGLAYDVSAEDASKDRQDAHRPNGCGVACLLLQREKHALAEVADDR